jgi:hypothetical protein
LFSSARNSRAIVLTSGTKEVPDQMKLSSPAATVATILLTLASPLRAQQPSPPQTAPQSARTETELLKTIVFITVELKATNEKGEHKNLFGTGFLVSVRDQTLDKRTGLGDGFSYLVTQPTRRRGRRRLRATGDPRNVSRRLQLACGISSSMC